VTRLSIPRSGSIAVQPAVDADTLVRSVLFVAVYLAIWISFHPFPSLADPPQELETGDRINQIGFSLLFLTLAGWCYFNEPRRLLLLLRPVLVAALAWCALSVIASWEPALAARRLAFTLIVMSIAAMSLLLPKNPRHFAELLAAVVLIVLALCYLGLVLVPQLAIHQATDFVEPEHAGEWRGLFAHKNEAGAAMVLFICVGMFVARMRSFALGGLIVALAGVFLVFTESKNAIGVLPLVLILSHIIALRRRPSVGLTLVLAILFTFNLFSVGSVLFEPISKLNEALMPDPTFTGRTEIWKAAMQYVAQRPLTGYGFSAFWGTPEVLFGLGEHASWVNAASDAHNAYLNLALTIGLPGLLLTILWVVISPITDFYRQERTPQTEPVQMLFLRICLFSMFSACFESSILQQVGEVWFFFVSGVFGLRYLSRMRITA
jgi:O-antigen ligase